MSLLNPAGLPCGTLPSKRKLRLPVRGADFLPNWTAEQAAQWWMENTEWDRDYWFPQDHYAKNQGRRGSCNYYAMVLAIERLIRRQYGYYIKLSPELGYANNVDGQDHGSLLSESLRDYAKIGAPPFLQRHYEKIRRRDFTAEDFKNAKRFTGIEGVRLLSWDMLVAAVAMGYPCVIAVHAGANFMDIDADGWCGVDRGPGNHAICVDRIRVGRDGRIGLENPGSWGRSVHEDGLAYIHEGHIRETIHRHEFWAATSMRLDPQIAMDFKLSFLL